MKMKKFIAPSMPEAMQKVRLDLGENAVILNSKVIYTGGFLGFFKKKNIEVIAAMDEQSIAKSVIKEKPKTMHKNSFLQDKMLIQPIKQESSSKVEKEIQQLKKMVENLSSSMDYTYEQLPVSIQEVTTRLKRQELNESTVKKIADGLLYKWKKAVEQGEEPNVLVWAKNEIRPFLSHLEFGGISYQRKCINIIGPTGVGKTTTIAKMAAEAVLEKGKKIAFITTDTYRIAAIEQLKTYANLLNVPVEVVYIPSDFQKALDKFSDYDLVFIDTAGRNYRDDVFIEDLKKLISFEDEMETYLVLSLTGKEKDLSTIVDKFNSIPIQKFIFTKLDETASLGSMFNLMTQHQIGAAYFTNGQDVPEDIVEASEEKLIDLLLNGET
jgi:flagellar biosynthesis protein FlhF